ncbi:MAG: 50S ribosomal protein L11 methyltransferase [Rhodospirillales bacterium]|nr:50S ribosomal protein L11 methyltransferase [Rhodospirillales bacterium]
MTAAPSRQYRVMLGVPESCVALFASALDPFSDAVSWTPPDGDGFCRLTGFGSLPLGEAALDTALALAAAAAGIEAPDVEIEDVPLRDWVLENLREFAPVTVGRFHIYGADFEGPVPASLMGLRVPAAAAFGSGQHGSTRGCLGAIDGFQGPRPRKVLDMGCGSGILALAMARKWRCPVIAVDSDPKATQTAGRNARANGLGFRVRVVTAKGYRPAGLAGGQFDFIASNILARPLMGMAGDLARHLAPGGTAVLSGFHPADVNRVAGAHAAYGLTRHQISEDEGWVALEIKKPNPRGP